MHLDAGNQTSPSYGYGALMIVLVSPIIALFWLLLVGAIATVQYKLANKNNSVP
jgi:hypothetical protein